MFIVKQDVNLVEVRNDEGYVDIYINDEVIGYIGVSIKDNKPHLTLFRKTLEQLNIHIDIEDI